MTISTDELAPTTGGAGVRIAPTGDRLWRWSRAPVQWSEQDGGVRWRCHGLTDFWRITEGVASAYDGSALLTRVESDFELELEAYADFAELYDQVGVMVAASDTHWLKAGVEIDQGFWLSAVHTCGESDWSRERWGEPRVQLLVQRHDATVDLSIRESDGWRIFRTLYLDGPVGVGPYSCSPKGGGFDATASRLLLRS